ncbi:hypothetical protein HK099_001932 [Clydaea vesicula]|uniref:BZIP domain-containing protein n=1 Tax=Clydaea vesicula TaxID=447962 RepID=A0AAD5U8Q3_9FUNG|nr:hypothetical protein HK099_001932 [Clydaea vesicula]
MTVDNNNEYFNFDTFLNSQQQEDAENLFNEIFDFEFSSESEPNHSLSEQSNENSLDFLSLQPNSLNQPIINQANSTNPSSLNFSTIPQFFDASTTLYDWSPGTAVDPTLLQEKTFAAPQDIFPNASEDDAMSGIESDLEKKNVDVEKKNAYGTIRPRKYSKINEVDDLSDLKERSGLVEGTEDIQIDDKNLTSKERRQIRNKISARNFRLRRKEYISTLEDEVRKQRSETEFLKLEMEKILEESNKLKKNFKALKAKFLAISLEKEEENKKAELQRQTAIYFSSVKPSTRLLPQVIKANAESNKEATLPDCKASSDKQKSSVAQNTTKTDSLKKNSLLETPNPHSTLFQIQALKRKRDLDLILKKISSTPALENAPNVSTNSNEMSITSTTTKNLDISTVLPSKTPSTNIPVRIATGSPQFLTNKASSKSDSNWLNSRLKVYSIFQSEDYHKKFLNMYRKPQFTKNDVKINKQDYYFLESLVNSPHNTTEENNLAMFKDDLLKKFLFLIMVSLDVKVKVKV